VPNPPVAVASLVRGLGNDNYAAHQQNAIARVGAMFSSVLGENRGGAEVLLEAVQMDVLWQDEDVRRWGLT